MQIIPGKSAYELQISLGHSAFEMVRTTVLRWIGARNAWSVVFDAYCPGPRARTVETLAAAGRLIAAIRLPVAG